MVKLLKSLGYTQIRQRGSHIRLEHESGSKITIPNHKELKKGITRKIIKDANLTVDEYIKLVKK